MAQKIDKMWINKEIRDYNELGGRTRDQESGMEVEFMRLSDAILSHLNFDRGVQTERQRLAKILLQHLDLSRDEVDGAIHTDATEIWDLLSAPAPERKTLKMSGDMRTINIDRGTGEAIVPGDVVEHMLESDETPMRSPPTLNLPPGVTAVELNTAPPGWRHFRVTQQSPGGMADDHVIGTEISWTLGAEGRYSIGNRKDNSFVIHVPAK